MYKYIFLFSLIFTIVAISFLRFSDPQICKYAYIFQKYYFPGKKIKVPSDFSGIWHEWRRDGTIISKEEYVKGRLNGKWISYNPEGELEGIGYNKNGQRDGIWIMVSGGDFLRTYTNGKLDGPFLEWDDSGKIYVFGCYKNGKPWNGLLRVWELPNGDFCGKGKLLYFENGRLKKDLAPSVGWLTQKEMYIEGNAPVAGASEGGPNPSAEDREAQADDGNDTDKPAPASPQNQQGEEPSEDADRKQSEDQTE